MKETNVSAAQTAQFSVATSVEELLSFLGGDKENVNLVKSVISEQADPKKDSKSSTMKLADKIIAKVHGGMASHADTMVSGEAWKIWRPYFEIKTGKSLADVAKVEDENGNTVKTAGEVFLEAVMINPLPTRNGHVCLPTTKKSSTYQETLDCNGNVISVNGVKSAAINEEIVKWDDRKVVLGVYISRECGGFCSNKTEYDKAQKAFDSGETSASELAAKISENTEIHYAYTAWQQCVRDENRYKAQYDKVAGGKDASKIVTSKTNYEDAKKKTVAALAKWKKLAGIEDEN